MTQLPIPCKADDIQLLVPAYFYPTSGNGWAELASAAAEVPLTAIFNPNSGPLPGPPDLNYVNAMTNLENAGGSVVAYIYTSNGSTPVATVEGEIGTYLAQYGSLIDGFYLDGMLINATTLGYYQALDSYILSLPASYQVIGNPGQPSLNGLLPTDYLSIANIFNIFEGSGTNFSTYPNGQNWYQSYPSSRFSNTIFDVPGSSSMLNDLNTAVALGAGYVYITDQTLPNPYGALPSYWDQEVSAVAALNAPASVPEPSAVFLLGTVLAGIVFQMRREGWARTRR